MITTNKTPNGDVIVNIPQILSIDEVECFRKEVNNLISSGEKYLILDFSRCEFIDSTGLGVLISIYKKCTEINGRLRLTELKPPVQKLITLTRLDRVFEII